MGGKSWRQDQTTLQASLLVSKAFFLFIYSWEWNTKAHKHNATKTNDLEM